MVCNRLSVSILVLGTLRLLNILGLEVVAREGVSSLR